MSSHGSPFPSPSYLGHGPGWLGSLAQVSPGQNVGLRGEDVARGQTVFSVGRQLKPSDVGLLASMGFMQVDVYRRTLWLYLGGAGVVLLLLEIAMLRLGLRPLRRVTRDLEAVERGTADRLTGKYPRD